MMVKKEEPGQSRQRGLGSLALGGQLTLEQMNLDRKTEFQGDAFDPFNIGTQNKKTVDVELQAQNAVMTQKTTVGGQIWTPEVEQKKVKVDVAKAQQAEIDELDDLEEMEVLQGDESMPPGGTPIEFQQAEENRKALQTKLD